MVMIETRLLGILHALSNRLDNITTLVEHLSEEVRAIRQSGVPILFELEQGSETEVEESESSESSQSNDSVNTWP